MLADVKPVIASMDENAWARNLGYVGASEQESIILYELNRHHESYDCCESDENRKTWRNPHTIQHSSMMSR